MTIYFVGRQSAGGLRARVIVALKTDEKRRQWLSESRRKFTEITGQRATDSSVLDFCNQYYLDEVEVRD